MEYEARYWFPLKMKTHQGHGHDDNHNDDVQSKHLFAPLVQGKRAHD